MKLILTYDHAVRLAATDTVPENHICSIAVLICASVIGRNEDILFRFVKHGQHGNVH
jgi:hypothetical protein